MEWNKKGQEEIMGFMLVILLIIVIGLAFVFFLRPDDGIQQQNLQVENMLYSVVSTSYDGQSLRDRISNCEDGIDCVQLGEGLNEVLNAAFSGSGQVIGQNLRGYDLNMSGGVLYYLKEGNQTGQSRGAATVVSDTLVRLRLYY